MACFNIDNEAMLAIVGTPVAKDILHDRMISRLDLNRFWLEQGTGARSIN